MADAPRELVGGCPLKGGRARPVKAPQASQARPAPHCVGRLLRGRSPREKPPHQGRWPRSRPEGFSPLTGSIAKSRAGHARPLRTAVNRCAREGQGRAAARPFAVGGWLPENWWQHTARRDPSGLAGSASSPDGEPFCGLRPRWRAAVKNHGGSGEPPTQKWRKGRGR